MSELIVSVTVILYLMFLMILKKITPITVFHNIKGLLFVTET
jgi:hypothetical protein